MHDPFTLLMKNHLLIHSPNLTPFSETLGEPQTNLPPHTYLPILLSCSRNGAMIRPVDIHLPFTLIQFIILETRDQFRCERLHGSSLRLVYNRLFHTIFIGLRFVFLSTHDRTLASMSLPDAITATETQLDGHGKTVRQNTLSEKWRCLVFQMRPLLFLPAITTDLSSKSVVSLPY
ncbi:hypothetical protein AVEN_22254-1 [Araneus ventricosus]|uniref:Uncharacterized protein n=1 Tax=Araneus ventricosus TaxID=182803 RepID=A0A4Y2U0N3_ARAVE|nr:hypothetical protein AVEN_22254-1 [Araneus ventricosus]